jgi:hypothetical protein
MMAMPIKPDGPGYLREAVQEWRQHLDQYQLWLPQTPDPAYDLIGAFRWKVGIGVVFR